MYLRSQERGGGRGVDLLDANFIHFLYKVLGKSQVISAKIILKG